jgi:hypothetical protein
VRSCSVWKRAQDFRKQTPNIEEESRLCSSALGYRSRLIRCPGQIIRRRILSGQARPLRVGRLVVVGDAKGSQGDQTAGVLAGIRKPFNRSLGTMNLCTGLPCFMLQLCIDPTSIPSRRSMQCCYTVQGIMNVSAFTHSYLIPGWNHVSGSLSCSR